MRTRVVLAAAFAAPLLLLGAVPALAGTSASARPSPDCTRSATYSESVNGENSTTKITANGCSDWFRAAVACVKGDGFGPPIKAVGKTSTASCPAGGGPISSEYGWEWSSNKTTWNDGQFTSV